MAKEPFEYFLPEARDLLVQLSQGALDLEKNPGNTLDIVQRLLRVAHTLKGAARVVKQHDIAERAHTIEDALTPFRQSAAAVPADRIDALLQLVDEISARVSSLGPAAPESHPTAPDDAFQTIRAAVVDMDALLEAIAESGSRLSSLRLAARPIDRARDLANLLTRQLITRSRQDSTPQLANACALAEELQRVVNGLERGLAVGFDGVDRELREVRQSAEQLRLVSARTIFTSLERTVRDASRVRKTRVRFEGTGGDVRVEAHVLAGIQRALLQIVRNAVAHGIEPEAVRKAQGKSSTGLITLAVARRGRRLIFRVTDDGRGVDIDAVRRIAAQRGVSDADTQQLGAEDVIRLLLRGGITTSPDVTGVAGRGIGLDIVRDVVEDLGGKVTVFTEAARGTTFEIALPVSLTSVNVLIVESKDIVAAVPLDSVRQTARVRSAEISRSANGESVVLAGEVIPFISLSRALRVRHANESASVIRSTIIVEGAGGKAAIGVDRCVGASRIIARPVPTLAAAEPVVAGLYLDDEASPQLILDPDALVAEAMREDTIETAPAPIRPSPVLVIDDSLTTRMLEQSILESAGYEVETVTSAEEALERARRTPYALFLVDVEMPGMDGFTFIERARAEPALRTIPAILVTSRTSPEDRERGHDVGAQGYVVKSEFNQAELLARIKELVG